MSRLPPPPPPPVLVRCKGHLTSTNGGGGLSFVAQTTKTTAYHWDSSCPDPGVMTLDIKGQTINYSSSQRLWHFDIFCKRSSRTSSDSAGLTSGSSRPGLLKCLIYLSAGCSARKECALYVARRFWALKWSCERGRTSIIWSVSRASDVINGSASGTNSVWLTTRSFALRTMKMWWRTRVKARFWIFDKCNATQLGRVENGGVRFSFLIKNFWMSLPEPEGYCIATSTF